jgi:TRAP-type uncharacterized transport system fused permease subunit
MKIMSTSEATFTSSEIRKRGFTTFIIGGIVYVLTVSVMDWLRAHGYSFHFALIPGCISFAVAAAGFVELVSGTSYSRLGRKWKELRHWQRGMLGLFIAVALLVIILGVVTVFVMLFG